MIQRIPVVFIIFSILYYCTADENDITELFVSLSYSNTKNLLVNEDVCDFISYDVNCDVYFNICMKSDEHGTCDLLVKTTQTFVNEKEVVFELRETLRDPIPKQATVLIDAFDYDSITSDDLIASFYGKINLTNTPESGKKFYLSRLDNGPKNGASLSIETKIQCGKNLYGESCQVKCIPVIGKSFCHTNGTMICSNGLTGSSCEIQDWCYISPCIASAECINLNDTAKCKCDGMFGPQCYLNFDYCSNWPCLNGGICTVNKLRKLGYECACSSNWTGLQCQIKLTACEIHERNVNSNKNKTFPLCLNNGTCVNSANDVGYYCKCPPNWSGDNCEVPIGQKSTVINIASISTACIVLVCLLIFVILCCCVKRRSKYKKARGYIYTLPHGRTFKKCNEPDKINKNLTEVKESVDEDSLYATIGEPYTVLDNLT